MKKNLLLSASFIVTMVGGLLTSCGKPSECSCPSSESKTSEVVPSTETVPSSEPSPESSESTSSEETPSPQDGASIGAFPSFGGPGGPPGMESSAESTAPSAEDWLLTGGCLVVILLSLFLIRKGRSHNR